VGRVLRWIARDFHFAVQRVGHAGSGVAQRQCAFSGEHLREQHRVRVEAAARFVQELQDSEHGVSGHQRQAQDCARVSGAIAVGHGYGDDVHGRSCIDFQQHAAALRAASGKPRPGCEPRWRIANRHQQGQFAVLRVAMPHRRGAGAGVQTRGLGQLCCRRSGFRAAQCTGGGQQGLQQILAGDILACLPGTVHAHPSSMGAVGVRRPGGRIHLASILPPQTARSPGTRQVSYRECRDASSMADTGNALDRAPCGNRESPWTALRSS